MNFSTTLLSTPQPPEQVLTLFVFKLFFLTAALLYIAFAFVIVRQIAVMKNTLITPTSPILTTLGYAHLALSILVFILFLLFL